MATTFSANARMGKPAVSDRNWDEPLNANVDFLDGLSPIGHLLVTTAEQPSASLLVRVTAGCFRRGDGAVVVFPGLDAFPLPELSTSHLWLDEAGELSHGPSFPPQPHVRLACVTTGSMEVTAVTDERICLQTVGTSESVAGGGESDGPSSVPLTLDSSLGPLQDSSTGEVGEVIGTSGSKPIDDNFATITARLNALIDVLQRKGLVGS